MSVCIVILLLALLLLVSITLGVLLCGMIKLSRYLKYYNKEINDSLQSFERDWQSNKENQTWIQMLGSRDKEFEARFQKLEEKNKELEKRNKELEEKVRQLEEYHNANLTYAYNKEIPNNASYNSYLNLDSECLNKKNNFTMTKLDVLDSNLLPITLDAAKKFRKVGPKKNKNSYSIENIMFEESKYGKLCIMEETYKNIFVEPEDYIIVEKTYRSYGLDICFKVNMEILAGHQYRIVNVKRQCEMKKTDNHCYKVLNKGELIITDISN